jgi:hypothetical protein
MYSEISQHHCENKLHYKAAEPGKMFQLNKGINVLFILLQESKDGTIISENIICTKVHSYRYGLEENMYITC